MCRLVLHELLALHRFHINRHWVPAIILTFTQRRRRLLQTLSRHRHHHMIHLIGHLLVDATAVAPDPDVVPRRLRVLNEILHRR